MQTGCPVSSKFIWSGLVDTHFVRLQQAHANLYSAALAIRDAVQAPLQVYIQQINELLSPVGVDVLHTVYHFTSCQVTLHRLHPCISDVGTHAHIGLMYDMKQLTLLLLLVKCGYHAHMQRYRQAGNVVLLPGLKTCCSQGKCSQLSMTAAELYAIYNKMGKKQGAWATVNGQLPLLTRCPVSSIVLALADSTASDTLKSLTATSAKRSHECQTCRAML